MVAAVLGWTAPEVVRAVMGACLAGDPGKVVELVGELAATGGDLRIFVLDLLEQLRSLLLVKLSPKAGEILGLAPEVMRDLEQRAAHVEIPHLELALRFLLDAEGETRRGSPPPFASPISLFPTSPPP